MEKIVMVQEHIFYLIVCAEKDVLQADVEAFANNHTPSGISSPWRKVEETFKWDGKDYPNPSPCADDPDRLHWILHC